jgi:anti-sigma B factor antagonist
MRGNPIHVAEVADHVWMVELVGEHDLATAPDVRRAVEGVFASGSLLMLDLSRATFIDSSVLAAVVQAQDAADAAPSHGLVVVAPTGSTPRRALDLVQLATWITVCETREAALATATALDSAAGARDAGASERDHVAAHRDIRAGVRDKGETDPEVIRQEAARDRLEALQDRQAAARDREAAATDREHAAEREHAVKTG